jgi:hypothetical protein
MRKTTGAALVVLGLAAIAGSAAAQDFYAGKQIRIMLVQALQGLSVPQEAPPTS